MKLETYRKQQEQALANHKKYVEECRANEIEVNAQGGLVIERTLEVLDIIESMNANEIARLKAIPAYEENWRSVKDIKVKYNLSWNELKLVRILEF